MYYAARYMVQKLIKKFRQSCNNDTCVYVGILLQMGGKDIFRALPENDT